MAKISSQKTIKLQIAKPHHHDNSLMITLYCMAD